ncbi:Leucine-rich repeat typical subtype [Penicillium chermesinum]|nr:Leucine-rich repeat typical subtype [Penicillium chermesinum]
MSLGAVGQRRSFDGHLCTIRYVGGVQGTSGDWLGVEWDDPTRGKHSGEHKGVRYFTCKNSYSDTAGSFVRPSRPSDPPRSFLEGIHEKYASEFEQRHKADVSSNAGPGSKSIQISGKVVEEVGFDKIRKQLAELEELRIVLLDGLRIAGVLSSYEQPEDQVLSAASKIATTCPKIIELDLSRNLLSRWRDAWQICNQLKSLKRLRLNGNRFQPLEDGFAFEGVSELHLDETLLSWEEIAEASTRFPALTSLTASANQLTSIACAPTCSLVSLTLENNEITSISSLRELSKLPDLEHLSLRGNNIFAISDDPTEETLDFQFPATLQSLDLSRNNISSWSFLNRMRTIFPGLKTLRISGNPIYDQSPLPPSVAAATASMSAAKPMTVDEAFMLTLSRFPPSLQVLNYSKISPQDRSNAEMYYLSLIGKELSAASEGELSRIIATHPRYGELCEIYGEPAITRALVSDGSGQRAMAFRVSDGSGPVRVKEVPNSFNTYQVKAIAARTCDLKPFSFKLVWETDEWDPVAKQTVDEADWADDSEDEMSRNEQDASLEQSNASRFVRREVELVDSLRDIGYLFQGEMGEVKIRVDRY